MEGRPKLLLTQNKRTSRTHPNSPASTVPSGSPFSSSGGAKRSFNDAYLIPRNCATPLPSSAALPRTVPNLGCFIVAAAADAMVSKNAIHFGSSVLNDINSKMRRCRRGSALIDQSNGWCGWTEVPTKLGTISRNMGSLEREVRISRPFLYSALICPAPRGSRRDPLQWLLRDQGVWGNRAVHFTREKKIEL